MSNKCEFSIEFIRNHQMNVIHITTYDDGCSDLMTKLLQKEVMSEEPLIQNVTVTRQYKSVQVISK